MSTANLTTRSCRQTPKFLEVEVAAGIRGSVSQNDGELWVVTRGAQELRMAGGLDRSALAMMLEVLSSC